MQVLCLMFYFSANVQLYYYQSTIAVVETRFLKQTDRNLFNGLFSRTT